MFKRLILLILVVPILLVLTGCTSTTATPVSTPAPGSTPVNTETAVPATATPIPLQPMGSTGNWKILFADEFDSPSLDTNVWRTCYWWDNQGCTITSNNELEWYLPQNVLVENGTLILEARQQEVRASNGSTYSYTSGMVTSGRATSDITQPPGLAFRYGFAEIRAKVPSGQGLWPAFWMLPITHESRPEIDILEILGHAPKSLEMNYHFIGAGGEKTKIGSEWIGPDFSQGWHTFGVDWEPDKITWYVDGVARFDVSDPAYISSEPMYILLNLAVGGDWPGSPDSTTPFPSRFEIDYVRVFEKADTEYLAPIEDTYLDSSRPDEIYGEGEAVYSDGEPVKLALLKYDTKSLAGRQLSSAFLRIHTTEDTGAPSENPNLISMLEPYEWSQETLNFTNFTMPSNTLIGSIENATWVNTVYQFPLDVEQIQAQLGSVITLAITSEGDDGLYIYTRESLRGGAQLILNFLDD